jgi:hypothetical protein
MIAGVPYSKSETAYVELLAQQIVPALEEAADIFEKDTHTYISGLYSISVIISVIF